MNNSPPDEPDTLEADLRAAFEADAEGSPSEAVAAPAEDPSQPRDEHGRFAPKEAVDSAPAPAQATTLETPAGEPAKAIAPPHTWTATAKAKFATLDPEVQAEVLRREKEMQDGLDQWAPKGEVFNRFTELMAPIRDRLTLNGTTDFQYLQALVRADEMLRTDPNGSLPQIAAMYGIQLPGMPQPQNLPQQGPMDPALQALQRQVSELSSALFGEREAKEQAEQASVMGEIEAFRADPANLYFHNVKPVMATLIREGIATDLKDAYDRACHADPIIRALLAKPAAAPQSGKANGASVTGSPGLTGKPNGKADPESTLEDDIRQAWAETTGGGRV